MTPKTPTSPTKKKIGFWLPDDLMEEVRDKCNRFRGPPTFLTINKFVARALQNELDKNYKGVRA